jgi:putative NADH-flavin reductase
MNLALIGATGMVGSRLLAEALNRGHHVTAIVRDPGKLSPRNGLTLVQGDATDATALASLLKGQDAVLCAYNGQRGSPKYRESVLSAYDSIVRATKSAGVKRLIVVGGAGSLEVAPGKRLVDTPNFPPEYKVEAQTFSDLLDTFRKESALDWTLVCPGAYLFPGDRTGNFRLGGDQLLANAQGESKVSAEDFAIGVLDEVEKPKHIRRRFTVAY